MAQHHHTGMIPLAASLLVASYCFVAIFLAGILGILDAKMFSVVVVLLVGFVAVTVALLQLMSRMIRRRSALFKLMAVLAIAFLGLFVVRLPSLSLPSLSGSFDSGGAFDSGFSQEFLAITSAIAWLVAKATRHDALHMFHYTASTLFVMSVGCSFVDLIERVDPLHFLEYNATISLSRFAESEMSTLIWLSLRSLDTARLLLLALWQSLGMSYALLRLAVQVLVLVGIRK